MSFNLGRWIHNFTVTDTQTHSNGYTIYKITSIVFPRSIPQALTCLVVWRRFHDVKRLHRELKQKVKALQIPGHLPDLEHCNYFKRFDQCVIEKRKKCILLLLDFAAQHPPLYTCHAFEQFFSDAKHLANPKVQCKRFINVHQNLESLSKKYLNFDLKGNQCDEDVKQNNVQENEKLANSTEHAELVIQSVDNDYIYEAALEFSHAVQAEANLHYREAYLHYINGIKILQNGSNVDMDKERKFIANRKISKYLSRVDDINGKFLKDFEIHSCAKTTITTTDSNNLQICIDVGMNNTIKKCEPHDLHLEKPWNHLANYKIANVINDKVLLVSCLTDAKDLHYYIIKGIEKPSSNSPTQTIYLPQNIPYMIELISFFQNDDKIFLLLQLATGGLLLDYVRSYKIENLPENLSENLTNIDKLLHSITSANDDYQNQKITKSNAENDVKNIVENSKKLLQSVENTITQLEQSNHNQNQNNNINDISGNNERNNEELTISNMRTKLPEVCIKQWARELLIAIHSLHDKGVILGDLNVDNLLLGDNGQLLLTYFHQNEMFSSDATYIEKALTIKALENHFIAPERPLTFKSDWWSYGVILYELLVGLPFKFTHPGRIDLYNIVQYPENVDISDVARHLLENLLRRNAEERYEYEQIKMHAFFEGTVWTDILKNGHNISEMATTHI